MTSRVGGVPDAVGAVIAAVLANYPAATPERLGQRVVDQLRRDGWVVMPVGRATTAAAGAQKPLTAAQNLPAVRLHQTAARPSTENEFTEMRQA